MDYGILMACYVLVSPGKFDWVEGREVKELRGTTQGAERSLFAPSNGQPVMIVETNGCKYLEDPVEGYRRMLASRKVDTIKVGSKAWCLVDEWGKQQCTFDTMEQCLRRMDRLSYCEPNDSNKEKQRD